MIQRTMGPNLGARSKDRESLTLAHDVSLPVGSGKGLGFILLSPATWTDFSTFGITDTNSTSNIGYLGYAAAAGLLYYLLFHSERAKERRAALSAVREKYAAERKAVYKKFGRV